MVNLTCGRNPWKRASREDATYRAYQKDASFLSSILPISAELDLILRRIFEQDPARRISLSELKILVLRCPKFTTRPGPSLPASPPEPVLVSKVAIDGYAAPLPCFQPSPVVAPTRIPASHPVTAHSSTSSIGSDYSDSAFSVSSASSCSSTNSGASYQHLAKPDAQTQPQQSPPQGLTYVPQQTIHRPMYVPQQPFQQNLVAPFFSNCYPAAEFFRKTLMQQSYRAPVLAC